jgi:hypothetical protein
MGVNGQPRLALNITKYTLYLINPRALFGSQKSVTKNYQNIVLSFYRNIE